MTTVDQCNTYFHREERWFGARTLDGNSLIGAISMCRTMIMLEESIKLAAKAYVFEPNVSSTCDDQKHGQQFSYQHMEAMV